MSRHSTASTSVAAATKFILAASQKGELVLQLFPLKKHDLHNICKPLYKEIDSLIVWFNFVFIIQVLACL